MEIYKQWMQACLQAGLPAISVDTAARLMAVLHEYGSNEGFVLNKRFLADSDYIQDRFRIREMCIPDPIFHRLLRKYLKELQDYQEEHKNDKANTQLPFRPIAPDWAPQLLKDRYNMPFIG